MTEKKDQGGVFLIRDPLQSPLTEIEEAHRSEEPVALEEPEEPFTDEEPTESLKKAMQPHHAEAREQNRSEVAPPKAQTPEARSTPSVAAENVLGPPPFEGITDQDVLQSEDHQAALDRFVEAIFFVSDSPISIDRLREIVGPHLSSQTVQDSITRIQHRTDHPAGGIALVAVAHGFQFRTRPEAAPAIRRIAKIQVQRLTKGAMETLAIVAYRQPVIREDIDRVRGVDSSHFVRSLLERNLIEMAGRSDVPGKPTLYRTTRFFLEVFGLASLEALPPLREIESVVAHATAPGQSDSDADRLSVTIRALVAQMGASGPSAKVKESSDDEVLKSYDQRIRSVSIETPVLDELQSPPTELI